ncbi:MULTISPECIES: TetR/AcrR family transcriptional regulator [unclassified Nocardioides]|uniref:TetR/AcrR family transcriptional regulator n=1 Tax=unclassified Nocardioides TaxID=2615069 RepID=UPI0030146036
MTSGPDLQDSPRGRIVEAAARLLREQGAGAVTTRGVAQEAGVQAPTIYRLFGDKDGLLEAVAEHAMATYVATKTEQSAAEGDDPVADLRAAWRQHLDFGLANPDLYTLLLAPGRRRDSPATEAGIAVLRSRVRRVAAAGQLRVPEDRAVLMIHAAGSGAVLTLIGTPPDERDPGLADGLLDAVLDRVLTSGPAAPDTSPTAVAVTFGTVLDDLPGLSAAERALMAEWLARATS